MEAAARVLQVGEQPAQAAFIARALNALAHLTTEMDERSLSDAAGATSDYAVLLRALEHPEALAVLRRRLTATRWPPVEPVPDASPGVQSAMQAPQIPEPRR